MNLSEYHHLVQVPAYVAVEAMRRAGIPVHEERARAQMDAWERELLALEQYVTGQAAEKGIALRYSKAHAPEDAPLREFLFSAKGLGLPIERKTEGGKPSTDDEALMEHAAVGVNHRADDHPVVWAILQIRMLSKIRTTHLGGLLKWRRADGCVHPKFNWSLAKTTRLAAEQPPVQQLPEKQDPAAAKLIKRCIVPRVAPWLGPPEDWDPRRHGWVAKVDVKGAEAMIRAGCYARCRVLSPYLREGRDAHSKTASILFEVPEGTYGKGTPQRDIFGKQCYFLLVFGGSPRALQWTFWKKARTRIELAEAERLHAAFFRGYPDVAARYLVDTELIFSKGYIEDPYGRRWNAPPPPGCSLNGRGSWFVPDPMKPIFEDLQHIYANRPTQCAQATTTLWCLALCHHGEYVPLCVPPYWERIGVPFPDAGGWQLNEGEGPDGKPLRAWIMNTVHDAVWLDGAPGTMEPALRTVVRRFAGVPADFLIEADMPWRVSVECGPDLGNLFDYEEIAGKFGFDSLAQP